jgi:hypothetical protein
MSAADIAATLGDAARDAATGWFTEGRRVRIALPPEPNTDFNDNKACHVAVYAIGAAQVRGAWITLRPQPAHVPATTLPEHGSARRPPGSATKVAWTTLPLNMETAPERRATPAPFL